MRITKVTKGSNKKWEGSRMMLPEHVALIRQRKVDQKKVKKHELDEQELEEIGYVVMDALNHTLEVRVIYWDNWAYHEFVGYVDRVDLQLKQIKFVTDDDEYTYVKIDCLKSVERI